MLESCILVCLSPFVGMRRQPEGEADAWLGWLDSKKNSKIYIFLLLVLVQGFIQDYLWGGGVHECWPVAPSSQMLFCCKNVFVFCQMYQCTFEF